MVAGAAIHTYLSFVFTAGFVFAPLVAVILFAGACLLWAPIGGAISMWLARGAQPHSGYPGLMGAAYAVTFLFPWVYSSLRARGTRVWRPAIWLAYVLLYVGWLWGPIVASFYGFMLSVSMGGQQITSAISVLFGGACVLITIAWCVTLYLLLGAALNVGRGTKTATSQATSGWPIDGVYYAPFAIAFGSLALFMFVGIYFAIGT